MASMKQLFTSTPVLVQLEPALQVVVQVDASDTGDRGGVVPAFWSKPEAPSVCLFLPHDVEDCKLLEEKLALEKCRHWLDSSEQHLWFELIIRPSIHSVC